MLNRARYDAYIATYNTQDWAAVAREFYDDDIVFEADEVCLRGPDVERFFTEIHRGMFETIHPEYIVIEGNQAAIEITVEMEALVDLPDFIAGPMVKGDKITSRWMANYTFRDGKITRLALFRWRPGPRMSNWPPGKEGRPA